MQKLCKNVLSALSIVTFDLFLLQTQIPKSSYKVFAKVLNQKWNTDCNWRVHTKMKIAHDGVEIHYRSIYYMHFKHRLQLSPMPFFSSLG